MAIAWGGAVHTSDVWTGPPPSRDGHSPTQLSERRSFFSSLMSSMKLLDCAVITKPAS